MLGIRLNKLLLGQKDHISFFCGADFFFLRHRIILCGVEIFSAGFVYDYLKTLKILREQYVEYQRKLHNN